MNLYIDIETIPDQSEGALHRCIETVEPPGNYKKAESIAEWKAANASAMGMETWQRTALDPMCGGIAVICWAVDDGEIRAVYRDPAKPESNLLEDWAHAMKSDLVDEYGQGRMPRFVGWNVGEFDLRYLAIRCAIHAVTPPCRLPVNEKFDGRGVCDLMRVWSGFKSFQKQSAVAKALGIKLLDETDGKDLWALIQEKGVQAAVSKCRSDIEALRQIHRRMESIFGC